MECNASNQAKESLLYMFKRKHLPDPSTSIRSFTSKKADRLRFAIALNRRFGVDTAPAGGCKWVTVSVDDLDGCGTWADLLSLAQAHLVPEISGGDHV